MTQPTTLLRNGTLYDGTGRPPTTADLLIRGDRIAAIGDLRAESAANVIDLDGLAVAPGFINMLSWATESLIEDGRSMSDIKQGVTLEVMGEGTSMGPLSDEMKRNRDTILSTADIQYDIEWTTLGEYLEFLERKGVATNVASFVGSATLRIHAAGYDDRPVTDGEMAAMKGLLYEAMREGAMGMSAALIYPPATYQSTEELIELCRVVAERDGMYITHLRSEGAQFLEALDELIRIMRETGVTGEIYHLKAAGRANWRKMDEVIARVEAVRAEGLPLTADMYTYPYSGTGLASCIPAWAHDGGFDAMIERLKDHDLRERIKREMALPSHQWENMFEENGPDGIMLAGFAKKELRRFQGKWLSEVMAERGTSAADTAIDLLIEDNSRIFSLYFSMSEDNLRKQVQLPWVSFCSDAGSIATEGAFLSYHPHPRAYGSFARVIGKYVRDEGMLTLEDAVRRLSGFAADNLKLKERGYLKTGCFADIAVFDPARVQDHSVPGDPHQYSDGMVHVFVNGRQALRDGEHTGDLPGRVVRGPGWAGP
ncbi:MAG: D-aminoacylase [Chloroflexota bacterium]|nr:D-aminoacylase [Chloroflexota bacterium]MDE2948139.1 D-aminoacylase [Chloroflexota bacterium]